jgi:hypothetical protein
MKPVSAVFAQLARIPILKMHHRAFCVQRTQHQAVAQLNAHFVLVDL